jgi:mannose-6-phosphate isomerase-like protein (cupin superfamily)
VLDGSGKTKFSMPDGSSREVDLKAGDVVLNPPTVHASEHMTDTHVLIVEVKK